MTAINTHYPNPPIHGGDEPSEAASAAITAGKPAVANLNIVGGNDRIGQTRTDAGALSALPPPSGNSGAGDLSATAKNVANLGTSAQADIYAFMGLFYQLSLESRKTASEMRTAEREAKFQELQAAADKIREAAAFQLAAGVVIGVATIGAGVVNMAGGLKSLKAAAGEVGNMQSQKLGSDAEIELDDLKPDSSLDNLASNPAEQLQAQQATQVRAQAMNMRFGGVASSVQGAGQIASAGLNYGASQVQAEQKENETKAEKDQAQVDMANELYQNMQQTIQDVLSKLAAMEQSTNDTNKQILRA